MGWELGSKRGRPGLQDHSTAASGPPSLLFPTRLQHRAPSSPGEGDPHRRWRLLYNHSSSRFCRSGQNRAANRIITSSPPARSSLPAVAPISVMGRAACHLVIRGTPAPPRGGLAPHSLPCCGQRSPRGGPRLHLVIAAREKQLQCWVCLADALIGFRGVGRGLWLDGHSRQAWGARRTHSHATNRKPHCVLSPACLPSYGPPSPSILYPVTSAWLWWPWVTPARPPPPGWATCMLAPRYVRYVHYCTLWHLVTYVMASRVRCGPKASVSPRPLT